MGSRGVRRLNVAITRARHRITLVSSVSHHDLDPTSAGEGVQLLRRYLEYAASGGAHLPREGAAAVEMNPFERSVMEALRAKGMEAEPQWGVCGYRIDLAVKHPHQAGRFVLAVECNGASYHSATTARDQDRLRQQHLEALEALAGVSIASGRRIGSCAATKRSATRWTPTPARWSLPTESMRELRAKVRVASRPQQRQRVLLCPRHANLVLHVRTGDQQSTSPGRA